MKIPILAAASVLLTAAVVHSEQRALTIEEVLFRANEYVVKYQRDFSSMVVEERYHQEVTSKKKTETRDLASDVLLMRTPSGSWTGYRDSYEVDGKAVRDHQERVAKLFLSSPGAAGKLESESTRFNIGVVKHNFNVPMLPLLFLDPVNQFRFAFQKVREEMVDGTNAWVVEFTEYERPTLIGNAGQNAFARGTFWIDPTVGRVLKTYLILGDSNSAVREELSVTYKSDETLGAWVPAEMAEHIENPRLPDEVVSCRATYTGFRRFEAPAIEKVK